jgi:hypothetical protein
MRVTLVTLIPLIPKNFICSGLNRDRTRSTQEENHLSVGFPSSKRIFPPVSNSVISLCIFYSLISYTFFLNPSYIVSRSFKSSFLSCILPCIKARLFSKSPINFSCSISSRGFFFCPRAPNEKTDSNLSLFYCVRY